MWRPAPQNVDHEGRLRKNLRLHLRRLDEVSSAAAARCSAANGATELSTTDTDDVAMYWSDTDDEQSEGMITDTEDDPIRPRGQPNWTARRTLTAQLPWNRTKSSRVLRRCHQSWTCVHLTRTSLLQAPTPLSRSPSRCPRCGSWRPAAPRRCRQW